MAWYRLLLVLHITGAAIWVGGHLVLSLAVLPEALRTRDVGLVRGFETRYERVGIPALAVQVVSGLLLSYRWVPGIALLFPPASPQAWLILVKLGLLAATIAVGAHARLRIVPVLKDDNLNALAYHAFAVTVLGLGFIVVGVAIRTGGLF